jgi:hypothetical protein
MNLISVRSSAIRAVGYDGHTLSLLFHSGPTVYRYYGVPQWVYDGLMDATSKGDYYWRHIEGRYR